MGWCFRGCFGSSSKHHHRHRSRTRHPPPLYQKRNAAISCDNEEKEPEEFAAAVTSTASSSFLQDQPILHPVSHPTPAALDTNKPEELILGSRKKVTFASNLTTPSEPAALPLHPAAPVHSFKTDADAGAEAAAAPAPSKDYTKKCYHSQTSSEAAASSSVSSSAVSSYPPPHRYHNCIDTDDNELDCDDSDVDDDADTNAYDEDEFTDADAVYEHHVSGEPDSCTVKGASSNDSDVRVMTQQAHDSGLSVLNPVENLTQWRAIKSKGNPQLKLQKENEHLRNEEEPPTSFSSEPCFKEISLTFKEKSDQPHKPNQDLAVDASLSTWLGSSACSSAPSNKLETACSGAATPTSGRTVTMSPHSPRSFDDRPILGALTMEEIRQFSAMNSPRRSPSRSPDEIPIIGTVGTYWKESGPGKECSGTASSYKGIPNTTSKYKEDKTVKWHSTPFETRLERALNGGAAEA